jgi:serine O-acetyltransferase
LIERILPGPPALEIGCTDIGPGMYIAHGFATIMVAERIGRDCRVHQNVTLGWKGPGRAPRIGDRVSIYPGAVVIGDISIGDDAVIGANAVVVKDVPPGDVVGGVPAKSLRAGATRPVVPARL